APGRTRVVDEDVQPVLVAADLGDQPTTLLHPGQVGRDAHDLAVRRQLLLGGRDGIGLTRADVDAPAALQQPAGEHHADATGAAGDDGDLAGDVEQVHGQP